MFNEIALVTVTAYSGSDTPDKNGEKSIMFQPIAGKIPNLKQVVSGTIGIRLGVEIGHTYLMRIRESGFDKVYGPDFQWLKIQECTSIKEILDAKEMLGEGKVITFDKPRSDYERSGDAIESQRTKRIKEGLYEPSTPTTVTHHESAKIIKEGTSVKKDETKIVDGGSERLNK